MKKIIKLIRKTFIYKFGKSIFCEMKDWLETLGFIGLNFISSIKYLFSGETKPRLILEQAAKFGFDSLPISVLMVGITGMIIAIQVANEMTKQGAGDYVGMLVSISIVRELGPVIGSFAVISLVGSSMSAEIATMKVTQQIDAMKVLRVNPLYYLIAPRILAGFAMMPFVVIVSSFVGIIGGMIMSNLVAELNTINYINSLWIGLTVKDIVSNVVKAFIFGGIIATTCSSIGYETKGGAIEVGNATTKAVVWSFILVLIFDYIISMLFFY